MIYSDKSLSRFKYTTRLRVILRGSIFCILFLIYSSHVNAQTAFWLESINNQVRKVGIASIPVTAASATNIAPASIPLFIFTDTRNNLVYWSDAGTGTIKKVSVNGGTVTTVVSGITGTGVYVRGIYLDITNNLLYWSETSPGVTDVIKRVNISGALPKTAASGTTLVSNIDIVRGITVDTVANQVYFADAGSGGSGKGIYRASLAAPPVLGSAATKIAVTTGQPNSFFIDRANNFIYWSNYSNPGGKIQRAVTNAGTYPVSPADVFTGESIRGIFIDIATNTIYWIEPINLRIRKAILTTVPITVPVNVVTALSVFPRDVATLIPSGAPVIGTDHYRTKQTGNWNDVNTWETSPDNGVTPWVPATTAPDLNANTITVLNTHTVTVTADLITDQTTINSGGAVIVNPNIVLTINDGSGTDITVASGGSFTLRSTASGTAIIGNSAGTVSGNFVVERFISAAVAKSAWRLLTAPLRSATTNGTIFSNWQNGGVNTAGRGTKVTGPAFNGTNGLDATSFRPSMQSWDAATQTLQPVTTTNNPAITPLFTTAASAANNSYFIYIDGDRLAAPGSPNTTTLAATGTLQTGNQTFTLSSTSNAFNLVGNPYASPVDLNQVRLGNLANNVKTNYYYWDPYLTGTFGYGAYVTVSYDGLGNETITPAGADHTRFLQSGQAMFVQTNTSAPASLLFTESQKATNNVNNIFRTPSGAIENMAVNLKVVTTGTPVLIDGIVTNFDDMYAAAIDQYDAAKFYNTGESIAFMRSNTPLSVERRPMPKTDDILYLNLTNLRTDRNYQFEFVPDFNAPAFTAYLKDNYLNSITPIDVNARSTVNFTVNSDAASTGANRFSILFNKPAIVQSGNPFIRIYPNPVTYGTISLQFNNMPQGNYNVRVLNSLGQIILTQQINHAAGSNIETIQLSKAVKGIYHLEVIKPDRSKFRSKVIVN